MNITSWRKRDKDDLLFPTLSDFGDFLEGFFPTRSGKWASRGELSLDIVEGENDIVVTTEVPGVDPKEIDIRVDGDVLTIRGEKKEEKVEEKKGSYRRAERWYGSFGRSVTLPSSVDASKIKARCKDGVLTVTLPKREEDKPKSIKIDVE